MRFARKGLGRVRITRSWVLGEGGGEVGRLQWQPQLVGETESLGRSGWGKDEARYLWYPHFLKEERIKLISGGEKATGCLKRKG